MKAKLKLLFKYITLFLVCILTFSLVNLLIVKNTVLKEEYVIKRIEEINYYKILNEDIKDEMSNYIIQAGFDESILDNIYTEDNIKVIVKELVHSFYSNKKYEVNTDAIKDNLESNIKEYIKKSNIDNFISDDIDRFTNQILTIYKNHLNLSNILNKTAKYIDKGTKYTNLLIKIISICLIVLMLIRLILLRTFKPAVVLFTNSFLLIIVRYLIVNNIDIDNLSIYNKSLSLFLINVLHSILDIFKIVIIACIVLGLIIAIITSLLEIRKKYKK